MSKIITLEDMNKDLFYKTPKAFFHNPKYMFMKNESKIAYGILRDILSLSIKNGWVNNNREPFVRVSREKLMVRLQVKGSQKMAAIMRELVDNELIIEKKLGQGNTNIIYVCIPDELQNVIYDDEELLSAITEKELDSCDLQRLDFENQKSAQTVDTHKSFENQRSKQHAIKGLRNIISKSKAVQNQSVIETNLKETKPIETNHSENNLSLKDNDNTKRIKESWMTYHNKEIASTTLSLLVMLSKQYEADLIDILIELSLSATKNENLYIKAIVREWKDRDVYTFDDYFNYEQNRNGDMI